MARTFKERAAYVEAYKKARKTEAGSPKALFGGNVANKAGKAAADKVSKKKKTTKKKVTKKKTPTKKKKSKKKSISNKELLNMVDEKNLGKGANVSNKGKKSKK